MSNYRKTMGQAIEEMYPINEDNMDLMRKAAGGAMQKIKMKDGKLQMDSFTASAIMKVYDKVNPANQKKMATMINKGTKDGMMKLQDFAMKQVKSGYGEEVELDEVLPALAGVVARAAAGAVAKKAIGGAGAVAKKAIGGGEKEEEEVDLDEVDRSTYDDRIKKFTGMLKDAEKEKPLDKEWISILKGHIKKTNAAQRRLLGMSEDVGLDEGKMKDLLIKAQELMGPSKNRKEGIQMVAKGLKVSEKEATKLVDEVIKMKMNEEVGLDEANKLPDMRNALMQVRTGEVDLDEAQDGGDFKPHMMYDPKTGKGYKADTMDDHLRMKKMGYNHDAPKTEEVGLDEESLDDFQDFARSYGGGDEIYVVTQGKDSNSLKVIGIEKDPNKAKKIRDRAKGARASLYGQMKSQQKVLKLKIGDPVSFEDSKNKLSFIEEVDLDEGKMSQLHQYIKDKKSAEEIAKLMKVDVKTIKTLMSSNNPEDVEESAASDARRAMAKDKDFSRKDSADDDDDATDDDVKGASKNIMMQLRKAQSLKGRFDVEFADGKKTKVSANIAMAVQQKYNAQKRPAEKEKFQAKIGKSYKDMLSALKEELQPKKESILERMNRKIKENKDG